MKGLPAKIFTSQICGSKMTVTGGWETGRGLLTGGAGTCFSVLAFFFGFHLNL